MKSRFLKSVTGLIVVAILGVGLIVFLSVSFQGEQLESLPLSGKGKSVRAAVEKVNAEFAVVWKQDNLNPAPQADDYTLIRRLSLALTGAVPSLEGLRRLNLVEGSADEKINIWLDYLFADKRYSDYVAERLARVYVGVETGPFLVYRRRRLVHWISEQLWKNRPYDEIVQTLVTSEGLWTSNPEANFITVTIDQNDQEEGPDEVKLAARTSRAFLGVSLDCMQCHDDMFGDYWKQKHFHGIAAFYDRSEMSLTGVRDNKEGEYSTRFRGDSGQTTVAPAVPFLPELLPETGGLRERLSKWITHDKNRAFSRAMVNRAWALLMGGKSLVEPVNEIPLEGPYPAGMDTLTDAFIESGYNLRYLFRTIANSDPFLRASTTNDAAHPVTEGMEQSWAAFPISALRPEQVIGSVIQASSLSALDADTHIFKRFQRFIETIGFVTQFGDPGEDEFSSGAGTIPQRLLLMNGKTVAERIKSDSPINSTARIALYSPDPETTVRNTYLTVLTRKPTAAEADFFKQTLQKADNRKETLSAMEDMYWTLVNSTEFSWNR